jgi:hypothetical protein
MFESMFKRPADQADAPPAGTAPAAAASPQRAADLERLRALGTDEVAAADFILQSEFSELRLAAAELIHSREQLERVHGAIRNLDRRVAKLLQGRLDAIRHHQSELARGQACVEQARHILDEAHLTPNHVADLDRNWSVVTAPELAAGFAQLRVAIDARLDAQTVLQRGVIDSLAAMRQLEQAELPEAELAQRLAAMAQDHAAARADKEHPSLPRHLLTEFASEHARISASVAKRDQTQATEQAASAQQAKPGNAQLADPSTEPVAAKVAPAKPPRQKTPPVADPRFMASLDAMEAALQQGSLHDAAEHDKALKDNKTARLAPAQAERLAHARAELKRLSDWARWGGNVSREELIKAVEQLPEQKQAMSELAKKVGSMRERWKGLDTLSGPAPKGLWEKFDKACTAAYAPAAAHFKQLSGERQANAAKARALIADALAAAPAADADTDASPDFKQIAATVQRLKQAWGHLGAIDRKEKKKFDGQFAAALAALQTPLGARRKEETARREQLIADVAALNPGDRNSLDALRRAQERWQELARALPLERKAEQALWQRFRAACDAMFAQRKESAHAADAERHAHQAAKEALCAKLEQASGATAQEAGKLLRDVAAEWRTIGAVPRAVEAKLEKRHQAAVAALEKIIDQAKRQAGAAQVTALRDKLRLCQSIEAAIAGSGDASEGGDSAAWTARWDALPALAGDVERTLKGRWQAALAAFDGDRAAYARILEQNRDTLLREVLRMEIVAGVDSGSEFARDRLKLQVEVLQSSLKSGQKPLEPKAQLLQLCAMPALADARTATRIEHLFRRLGKDGK